MRIRVTSRGGFTGVPTTRELDVDALPEVKQKHIRELVDRGVWPAPEVQRAAHPQPQDFDYSMSVNDGPRAKTIRLHKSAASAEVRELVGLVDGG
jgi:hypothetical protein